MSEKGTVQELRPPTSVSPSLSTTAPSHTASSQTVGKTRIGWFISKELQVFGCVLLLQMHLPLVPLVLEFWTAGEVEQKNVVLTAAIYVISVGLSSRNILMLSAGIFSSIVFSAMYGVMLNPSTKPWGAGWIAFAAIEVAVLVHSFERYNRHVVEGEAFLVATDH